MSKQKNTPKDPTQELLDHEPAVFGTSQDDLGTEETSDWPTNVPKSNFTPKQRGVVEKWVNSGQNGNLERDYLREWVDGKDCSLQTARRSLFKAFPDDRDINNFTMGEKLAIAIIAHEGRDIGVKALAREYPLSKYPFKFVKDTASDIISDYVGKVEKEDLEEYIGQYQEKNGNGDEDSGGNRAGTDEMRSHSDENEQVRNYYKNNPNATTKEVKAETGVDLPLSHIGGVKGNLVRNGNLASTDRKLANQESGSQSSKENGGVGGGIEVTLTFDSEEVKDVLSDKDTDVDIKGRVIDKLIEEAMG